MWRRKKKKPLTAAERHRGKTEHLKAPVAPPPRVVFVDKVGFRGLLRQLGFDSYQEYLISPLWIEIRNRVLRAAKHRCLYCGERATQVHHEFYTIESLRGDSVWGMAASCPECHEAQHGGSR